MKALESQIKEFDKAIKAQMELLPNVLISIPGIGPVYSAGIMAEIGDINRFNSQAALAKYAGLAWKQHQSGGFEVEVTRLIPYGNRFLRYYLCEAAFSLVRCDKEYSDFYHLKYKEVNRCQHKRALALTAVNDTIRMYIWKCGHILGLDVNYIRRRLCLLTKKRLKL